MTTASDVFAGAPPESIAAGQFHVEPSEPYLTQILHRSARLRPNHPCFVYGQRRTSYAELAQEAARLAGALRTFGVKQGDRVSILSRNSDRMIVTTFATWWAGAVSCPLNIRWSPRELSFGLADSGSVMLFVDEPFLPLVPALLLGNPQLRTIVSFNDDSTEPDVLSYQQILLAAAPIADAYRGGHDLAYLMYTGGTTGTPKGVMLSHANVVAASLEMLAVGCGTGHTYLHAPPLFHIAGVQLMIGHFLGGQGPHIIVPSFTPTAILEAIEQHRVTDVLLVPTMLQMVLADPAFARYDLTSLQRIFYGAAPMTDTLLSRAAEAIPTTGFIQGYGMTESALTVMLPPYYYTEEGRKLGKTSSVGLPLPLADVAIRDPDGVELPVGQVGELTVRSPSVMLGYWNNPAATTAALRNGWLHTGDGALMDGHGFVYLVDRLKDMIISGGENVYSLEVENVLVEHPAVAAAAVIAMPDERLGERVHAVLTLAASVECTAEEITAFCRARLAGYKVPRSVEFRAQLPTSAAGKILKNELRAANRR